MAHNDYPILVELLKDIDDERNDIYLHIDVKSKDAPFELFKSLIKKSQIFIVPQINVMWGGYSQVECELRLMEQATKKHSYEYYHLLTGATFPLKSQDYIHNFFLKHRGKEFIGFAYDDCRERVEDYYLFNEIGKPNTKLKKLLCSIRGRFRWLQHKIHYKRQCSKGLSIKKGFVYWSLTDSTIKLILEKEDSIKKWCKHGLCVDEIFSQTIVANFVGLDKVFNYEDQYESCMRDCPWHMKDEAHKNNFFRYGDEERLIKSNKLFALKFGAEEGLELIKCIKNNRI